MAVVVFDLRFEAVREANLSRPILEFTRVKTWRVLSFTNTRALTLTVYRSDIDGLRAVAVVPVVLYHAGLGLLPGGYVGVDVFFVISGYLITSVIREKQERGAFSLLGFYERRARRILPALFLVLAASTIAAWIFLLPEDLVDFSGSLAATAVFTSNVWFWRADTGGYFANASEYYPLLHTWSLAVEEQFYLLYPLLLMGLARSRRTTVLLVIGALAFASVLLSASAVPRWPSAAFYLAPSRTFELGLGALLALAPLPDLRVRTVRETIAAGGLVAITASVLVYNQLTPFPGLAALAPCCGAAALIWAGGSGPNLTSALLASRPMVLIGLISYSLYLWHWPILSFLRWRLQSVELPIGWAAAAVISAGVLAALSWAFVEKPFRNRAFLTRGQLFALAGAAMTLAIAGSAIVWFGGGFPGRLPIEAMQIASAKSDINPRRDECFQVQPPRIPCQVGAPADGAVDFLVWGDSHADALLPGIERAARAAGQTGLFTALDNCPPLLGVDRQLTRGGPYTGCRNFNDAIARMLRDRSDIETVILVSRWAAWETGSFVPGEDTPVELTLIDNLDVRAGERGNSAVFERGLQRTVETLTSSGRKVVVIAGLPEIGWNVPGRLYARSRWGDALPTIPTQHDVEQRNAGVYAVLQRLARTSQITVVRLDTLLCSSECRLTYMGRPIYVDDDHISAFAAREVLASGLEQNVFGAVGPGPSNIDALP